MTFHQISGADKNGNERRLESMTTNTKSEAERSAKRNINPWNRSTTKK
jgi:hypothetical protein